MTTTTAVDQQTNDEKSLSTLLKEQRDQDIWTAMQSLGGATPIEITLYRVKPKLWNGKVIEGEVAKFDEKISSADIREQFGGGSYQIQLKAADRKGVFRDVSARLIKIAGDPIVPREGDGEDVDPKTPASESPNIIRDVLKMADSRAQEAERRAERMAEKKDPSIDFLREQVLRLQSQLHEKEEKLLQIVDRPQSRDNDGLLGKFLEGESARVMSLRQQHESELRLKSEMHRDEINRANDRFDRMLQDMKSSFEREISNLKHTYDTQIMGLLGNHENQLAVVRASYDGQLEGLKREIAHLSRLYDTAQAEVAELRTRKERSLVEQMAELGAVKEAFESFGGGEREESTLERVFSSVAPALEGIVNRVSAPAQPQQLPPQAMPTQPQIRQLPDGSFQTADGRRLQRKKPPEGVASLSDSDLQAAIVFFENGLNNNLEPAEFARTAKSIAPQLARGDVREALAKTQGVDALLARVSKLSPDSALLTQHGRNWVRKVVAELVG